MELENSRLSYLIEELDKVISGVRSAGLEQTVALLKIARLDLVMQAHGVTEYELEMFLHAVETNLRAEANQAAVRPKSTANSAGNLEGNC
jgi:hypothetical protein